jgi:hypothetical protein
MSRLRYGSGPFQPWAWTDHLEVDGGVLHLRAAEGDEDLPLRATSRLGAIEDADVGDELREELEALRAAWRDATAVDVRRELAEEYRATRGC